MKLRIGILSTASIVPRLIGAVRAAEVYLSDRHSPYEGFTVSSIASRSLKNARQKALLWNVPKAFGSYEELIESGEADVIYIAMINSEHYHYARLALEAGRHVLCEKPFTLEPSQAEELFALARRKGLFLMEMQKVVFLPVVRQIKDLIQKGGFGRITMADFSSSFDAGYNGWFFDGQRAEARSTETPDTACSSCSICWTVTLPSGPDSAPGAKAAWRISFPWQCVWKMTPYTPTRPASVLTQFTPDIFMEKKVISNCRITGKHRRPFFIIKIGKPKFWKRPVNMS